MFIFLRCLFPCLRSRCCRARLAMVATLAGIPLPAHAAVVADSADDVCAALANPCVVTREIDVADGGRLDFGLRTLRIEGAGLLDFAAGDAEVSCGRLEVATGAVAIRVRGTATGATGRVALLVRKSCSLAPALPCLSDPDCAAASAGLCSGGDGGALIDGAIQVSAEVPGRLVLRAAGDVSLLAGVSASGTAASSDGGVVEFESTAGSVFVDAPIDASGGGDGSGGEVTLAAATDVVVRETIEASGGEYDGGTIALEAGRDVIVAGDLVADSTSGAGFGGEIAASAARDVAIEGGSSTNSLLISTDGHQSADNYGGDGGTQSFEAGRDIRASRYVRFSASAAPPDGFADTLTFAAEGGIAFDATVVARGRGLEGGGALVDLVAGADVVVSATASFDLTGPASGGDLMLECDGSLDFAGGVDVSGGSSGVGGRVVAVARGDADVSGRWTTAGGESVFTVGELFLEACRARVAGTLRNSAVAGRNRIVGHDSIALAAAGSLVSSGERGTNSLRYRRADSPPLLDGAASPVPVLAVDAALEECAVCGDAEVEDGEGCDDGNLDDGDGCSARCEPEGCGAGAPPTLSVGSLRLRLARDGTADRMTWRGELPAAMVGGDPSAAGLRVLLSDETSRPLVAATLPAGSLAGGEGAWRYKAAADDGAAAIVKATLDVVEQGTVVRARFKLRGELDEAFPAGTLVLAVVFGDEPATSPCSSSGELVCERGRRSLACSTGS